MTGGTHAAPAVFGQRLRHERERRAWSLRDLAAKSGVNATTVLRAEQGHGVTLSIAAALAAGLGLPLTVLLTELECARCSGVPPEGFICGACGLGGAR